VLLRKYCSRQDYRKQEPIVNISDFALGAIFASSQRKASKNRPKRKSGEQEEVRVPRF
jgi:hypothetical protein